MKIAIASKTQELNKLQEEIAGIQKEITSFKDLPIFESLDIQLNERLDKMEKGVIAGKREKLLQERFVYESSQVYVWRKPILV